MTNLKQLAGQLGISDKQLAKLTRKHGDALESVLAKWWNETRERPRLLGKQGGYTTSSYAALHTSEAEDSRRQAEPEAVSDEYQRDVITKNANIKWTLYVNAERAEEVAEQQGKQLVRKLRKLQLQAAKQGVDITPQLAAMIQEAEAVLAEDRRAA